MIVEWRGTAPRVDEGAFVAENATLVGDVKVGKSSSVWFGAVLRGDIAPIVIGERTSIQDGCLVHVDPDRPTVVGNDVTVGHGAILHSARIGDNALIGMGAIILDAEIGAGSLVGAGALVPSGKSYPANHLILGSPAKAIRELTPDELAGIQENKDEYVRLTAEYLGNDA